jgi:elongation factor G
MSEEAGTRCVALVGPQSSGKTTLLESMLFAAGTIPRKGRVQDKSTVSDTSDEARSRSMSTELTPVRFSYLGDPWVALDCPGAVDLIQAFHQAIMVADAVIVVTDPDPERMVALGPTLRLLDAHNIPHMLFINKMDSATAPVKKLLAAAQEQSQRPLILRHIPLMEGPQITGYVDLVAERAYHYKLEEPSERISMGEISSDEASDARRELLETLSDFDDSLLEQLLEDIEPERDEVYRQITKDLANDLIVPVLLGAADRDNGVRRLLKALRHEVPSAGATADRLGLPSSSPLAQVYKINYALHVGKLTLIRLWRGTLKDGDTLGGHRVSNMQEGAEPGLAKSKVSKVETGDFVALSRMEAGLAGDLFDENRHASPEKWPSPPTPLFSQAVSAKDRKDDVKLTESLRKICEEDPSLILEQNTDTHEMLLKGQGDVHINLAIDRLKRKFDLELTSDRPQVAYKETIRKPTNLHTRFKRQSGGHGQFADIKVDIKPLPRGSGVQFEDTIVGGVVPKNYIPAVEAGVRDNTSRGPLGFTVVDVHITLVDGQFHAVDSSDQAFRTAGRMAMTEGLPACIPVLLEPINEVQIVVPTAYTSKVQRAITQRRAQIQGFDARKGWSGWDQINAHIPVAEMQDLITEIRSLSLGIGTFEAGFSHFQELSGRDADKVVEARKETKSAD